MDSHAWVASQSGRRKQARAAHVPPQSQLQDYGPKVNFKRRKLRLQGFSGLPSYAPPILAALHASPHGAVRRQRYAQSLMRSRASTRWSCATWSTCLSAAHRSTLTLTTPGARVRRRAVQQQPPCRLWGERLVTLNLLSDTVLSFVLPCAQFVVPQLVIRAAIRQPATPRRPCWCKSRCRVARLSLWRVRRGARHCAVCRAVTVRRYRWQHMIQRHNIAARRIACTLRELAPELLDTEDARLLFLAATCFSGVPVS